MPDMLIQQLIALRRSRGLSQRELGELSGVPYVTIARIEHGNVRPTLTTVNRLLRVLRGKTEIVPEGKGFQCRLKVKDGIVRLPSAVLKRLNIKLDKPSKLQLRDFSGEISIQRDPIFQMEMAMKRKRSKR